MSRSKFPLLITVLALAIAMFVLQSTGVALQDPASSPSAARQQHDPAEASPPPAMPQASEAQTFAGTIAKVGGKYVLKDQTNKMIYLLDDQDRAKEFEGKSVKVTGALNTATKTIRVAAIEPGS